MISSTHEYPDFLKSRQRIETAIVEYLSAEGQLEVQDWLQRYPDLTLELREFLENQQMIGGLVDPWRPEPECRSDFPVCQIGQYEIMDVIDRGGMGVVYKARSTTGGQIVALKMINQERFSSVEVRERFRNEAEAAARLKHPHFVAIHEVGEHHGVPYYSMDYIEGQTLADYVQSGRLSPRRSVQIVHTVARAIDYAHSTGVLHRDLKPSNILIDTQGEVHITDFGLAKQLGGGHTITETGQILGSIDYMPPEQAQANHSLIGPASDIYSIGAILYELLTGRPPFQGDSVWEMLRQIREDAPQLPSQLNSAVTPELDQICLKCLEKKPSRRYLSGMHLATDLASAIRQTDRSTRRSAIDSSSVKRRGFLAISGYAALIASACVTPLLLVGLLICGQFSNSSQALDAHLATTDTAESVTRPSDTSESLLTSTKTEFEPASMVTQSIHDQPGTINAESPPAPAALAVAQPRQVEPPLPPAQEITLDSIAYSGSPFGVGKLSFKIPAGDEWRWYPDQPARVISQPPGVLYGSFEYRRPEGGEENATFTAWFLFRNQADFRLTVSAGGRMLTEDHPLAVKNRSDNFSPILIKEWWTAFNQNRSKPVSEELRPMNEYFQEMLARRLNLEQPPRVISQGSSSDLERQFERSVGMLFGFESVLKSMMELGPLPKDAFRQAATLPKPEALTIPSVRFDPRLATGVSDPLARSVPQECFYFRFSRVANYRWVRGLIKGWGGSMDEIVSTPAVDHEVRDRIEQQLAFDPDRAIEDGIDSEIEDCALIGLDTYFHEGAALGVLFQSKPGSHLRTVIENQRNQIAGLQEAIKRSVEIDNVQVPFLSTVDFRVRSFYVTQGDFHLITNSRTLAAKFLQTKERGKSIGELPEYLYARNKYLDSADNYLAVLYLPDPFFRNITSPEYRIEVERRRHAAREIRQLELALVAAEAERMNPRTPEQLIAGGFLAEEFGQRPDESRPIIDIDSTVFDSYRGRPGTLCPIPDLTVSRVTRAEIEAYEDFKRAYRREWRAVDPVLLSFAELPDSRTNKRKVLINVHITPYAQEEYGFLQRVFSRSPGTQRLAMVEGELLGLSASLHNSNLTAQVHFGLVDDEVNWEIKDGEIMRRGDFRHSTFAQRNSYTHVTPFNTQVMSLLSELSQSLQNRDSEVSSQNIRASSRSAATAPPPAFMIFVVESFTAGFTQSLSRLLLPAKPSTNSRLRELPLNREKLVYTNNSKVRSLVNESGKLETGNRPAHMVMRLNDVSQSKVADYIRAYTFVSSRRLSGDNVAALNRLAADLNMSPEKSKALLEQLIDANLQCPAGGKIQLSQSQNPQLSYWESSIWQEPTLYRETAVPEEYTFGFLGWLRGLTLESTLHTASRTLHSRLELELHETKSNTIGALAVENDDPKKTTRRSPQVISGILLSNHTDRTVSYRCRRVQGVWSQWHTLSPGKDHRYEENESLQIEYQSRFEKKLVLVGAGSHMEFVSSNSTRPAVKIESATD